MVYNTPQEKAVWEQGKRDGFNGKKCDRSLGFIYADGWREGAFKRIFMKGGVACDKSTTSPLQGG